MNMFFLFLLPLNLVLANETKPTAAFDMNSAVNITSFISGLTATDDGSIVAIISGNSHLFQDILSGVMYKATNEARNTGGLLFVSKDKAYAFTNHPAKLAEYTLQGSLLKVK
ncbi:hypothetical protein DSO57_1030748 [Entomophthora muscae]|uniref:Uncharacterized protein n=1 Tax=Entomophthora muscae TaxID=34485 RepID=A0ACC2SE70_9FUNG|nr:hypothetical protein DSO57_1030748 [Entomophthora muscae]